MSTGLDEAQPQNAASSPSDHTRTPAHVNVLSSDTLDPSDANPEERGADATSGDRNELKPHEASESLLDSDLHTVETSFDDHALEKAAQDDPRHGAMSTIWRLKPRLTAQNNLDRKTTGANRWSLAGLLGKSTIAPIDDAPLPNPGLIADVPTLQNDTGNRSARSSNSRANSSRSEKDAHAIQRNDSVPSVPKLLHQQEFARRDQNQQLGEITDGENAPKGLPLLKRQAKFVVKDDDQLLELQEARPIDSAERSSDSNDDMEDRERERNAKSTCFGLLRRVAYDDLPDLPRKNAFGMKIDHPVRSAAIKVAISERLEVFIVICALIHFLIALPEVQDNVFGCSVIRDKRSAYKQCRYTLPEWYHLFFLFIFTVEAIIKITGLGLWGGKFSWWTQDHYNKFDIIAFLAYFYEAVNLIAFSSMSTFTLRGFRLMRLLRPLGKLVVFADLEIIFAAFGQSLLPMATVLLFIWFVLILFGIMGMAIYGSSSFRRRCVWADTLEVKVPEQFCKRNEIWQKFPDCTTNITEIRLEYREKTGLIYDAGGGTTRCNVNPVKPSERKGRLAGADRQASALDHNCGPFQLCLDVANPNYGFTSFDHLPASLITLFQVMSGDNDVLILWYATESEPSLRVMTLIYFLLYTFLVLHVLINVFVAVFANIFATVREEFQEMIEKRKRGDHTLGSTSSSVSGIPSNGAASESIPSWEFEVGEIQKPLDDQISNKEPVNARDRLQWLKEKSRQEQAENLVKAPRAGSAEWIKLHLKTPVNPSLQHMMRAYFRDNLLYDGLCVATTVAQSVSLALIGQLCDESQCSIDSLLDEIILNCNYLFMFDQLIQIICDGSLAHHFEKGENIFKFMVNFLTTTGLALDLLGVSRQAVAALRGTAIFRLLSICKYGFLEPIWLMLIKAADALVPVMNLCLFNTLIAIIYYSLGRSLLKDSLSDNFRYNYSNLSRGYMLLLTVLTGDSWSGLMYEGMSTFCAHGENDDCDYVYTILTALFYMIWFFYGQFLFITMFLAIILEAFAVSEFMDAAEVGEEETFLTRNEAIEEIAKFQMVPPWYVKPGLVKIAFEKLSTAKQTVPQSKLLCLVRMVQPMTGWRYMKLAGIPTLRYWLRKSICICLENTYLKPLPGDEDFILDDNHQIKRKTEEEAEIEVASKTWRSLKEHMNKLHKCGLLGQVMTVAKIQGVFERLDLEDLSKTDAVASLKIVKHASISHFLQLGGTYQNMIEDIMNDTAAMHQHAKAMSLEEANEYVGLDLSKLDDPITSKTYEEPWKKKLRRYSTLLVQSPAFGSFMFGTILVSSIFLCLEGPQPLPGALPMETMATADVLFNSAFTVEFLAKAFAHGFYTPLSVDNMAYLQSAQNRIDLFVLVMALAEMTGAGAFIGSSTTKVIRLMKVMRPVRLLLRSDGLRKIIEALIASLKPMFYATLFLLIMCAMFSVTGMAFFRNKFHSCTDSNLDGLKGEGRAECTGSYISGRGYYEARVWSAPPWGSHFDSLASSVIVLFRVLTLNWSTYYQYAQDAYDVNLQPVPGFSMSLASLYFHVFLLVGSFFGLNLFASFMCDTFYSLQGTEQLEEVQWLGVIQMLKSHQPRKRRRPPKNIISTSLRQLLASSMWQNFSALCLLLNVTFMGSTHSTQDASFTLFLDEQNTVFFALMCAEAGLHLVSLGPQLYLSTGAHQFDIFLITGTAATMIFADTLRSLSQGTRILRLFKFLRQLAKDRTIANVFETVLVSMGQVVNIVIILIVVLIMLSVLSVQLFGLVREGKRLGGQANFKSFPQAFQTISQLMFGEDMPTLWDDCMISEPECSPDVVDSNGQLLHPSDCASGMNAVWFFPAVLVLTNYVMLNLFVGMIMNNFAYIEGKGQGTGLLEDEHLIDAAFKYVEHLDPKLKKQIPLEQFYQFYNMIGGPLGNYGTTKNLGRYLCVREELKRILEEEDEEKFSWFYHNVYLRTCEKAENLQEIVIGDWKRNKELISDLEKKLRQEQDEDESEVDGDEWDNKEDDNMQRDGESQIQDLPPESDFCVTFSIMMKYTKEEFDTDQQIKFKTAIAESACTDPVNIDILSVAESRRRANNLKVETKIRVADATSISDVTKTLGTGNQLKTKIDKALEDQGLYTCLGVSEPEAGCTGMIAHVEASSFGANASIVHTTKLAGSIDESQQDFESVHTCFIVSGGNMGANAAPPKRIKQVKRRKSNTDKLDTGTEPTHLVLAEQARLQRIAELQDKLEEAKGRHSDGGPRTPLKLRLYTLLRKTLVCFLSEKESNRRLPGHVRYDEIIMALIYWNKEMNLVPSKMVEARKDFDKLIRYEVAFQLISAVCRGGVVRHRLYVQKRELREKLKHAGSRVAMGEFVSHRLSSDYKAKNRRRILAPRQNESAANNLWIYTDDPKTGPLKSVCCKVAMYGLASGSRLADMAEDLGYEVGENGIFELTEEQLEFCFTESKDLRKHIEHAKAIEQIMTALKQEIQLAPAYLKLAAQKHGICIGENLENLTKLSLENLQELIAEPHMALVISPVHDDNSRPSQADKHNRNQSPLSAESPHAEEHEQSREDILVQEQLEELKEEYRKQEERILEASLVVQYSQKRLMTMQSDIEKRRKEHQRLVHSAAIRHATRFVARPKSKVSSVLPKVDESKCDVLTLSENEDADNVGASEVDADHVRQVYILPDDGDQLDNITATIVDREKPCYNTSDASSIIRPFTAPAHESATKNLQLSGEQDDEWSSGDFANSPKEACVSESSRVIAFENGSDLNLAPESDQGLLSRHQREASYVRASTAPERVTKVDEVESLQVSLQITKAEIERLERLYQKEHNKNIKARQAAMLGSSELGQDEAAVQARARRDQKHNDTFDSESTSSCLLSPRDKPTRKDLIAREIAKKQRAAEERLNGGQANNSSSRASSRQSSRPSSRMSAVGITF